MNVIRKARIFNSREKNNKERNEKTMLFGKRKLSLDDILKGIDALSDEDKERLRWELGSSEQPSDEISTEQPAEAPAEEPATEETPADVS